MKRYTDPKKWAALESALEAEHCYGNCGNSCNIHAAFEGGLYLWAAHLLIGATECYATEDAYLALDPTDGELEAERLKLVAMPHVVCRHCGSHCWTDEREDSCGACGHELPCTEDPVCVRGYLHRGGHEDKNGFVKPEDDEKMNNPQNGKRVRTAAQLRDTDGLLVHPDYLAARKPDTDATLVNAVPGYGGDVWRARHDDGDEAVYVIDEMEAL